MRRITVVALATLMLSACAKRPTNASVCDSAADLVAVQYKEFGHEPDKVLLQRTGRPRLYFQILTQPVLTSEQIDAVKSAPGLASSVMASLSLAGDHRKLAALAKSGLSPDTKSEDGVPLVVIAAACDRRQVVEVLLAAGADVYRHDPQGVDAMATAIVEDNDEIASDLVARGYKLNPDTKSGRITARLVRDLHHGKYRKLFE